MDAVDKFLAGISADMDPPDALASSEQLEHWANGAYCPKDTDGDGNCGDRHCMFCGRARRFPKNRNWIGDWLQEELCLAANYGDSSARDVISRPRMLSRIRSLADDVWTDGRPATRREFIDGTFRRYHTRYGIDPATMSLIWLMIRAVVFFLWRLYQIRNGCAPGSAMVEA